MAGRGREVQVDECEVLNRVPQGLHDLITRVAGSVESQKHGRPPQYPVYEVCVLASGWSALNHRVQLPGSLDALQWMAAAVLQGQIRPHHQITHGPGGENLPRPRSGHDPGGDVDRDPPDVV